MPLLLAGGCLLQNGEGELRERLGEPLWEDCQPEVTQVRDACSELTVGTRNNNLSEAIVSLRECTGIDVRALCQQPGYGEPNVLTWKTPNN